MKLRVALVIFCYVLDFNQPLVQSVCVLTGLGCTNPATETFFRFYRSLKDYTDVYKNNCSSLTSAPGFDLNKNTTFYFHGWTESVDKTSARTIASAYTTVKEENIVAFDWSIYTINVYPAAVSKLKFAANESLNMIECFIDAGLRADSIKLLGFSLGGQLVGAIGNSFKERNKRNIRHITGLDPALPGFFPAGNNLKENSGDFVFVIHTASLLTGFPAPMGTVDFLPNLGIAAQPPCPVRSVTSVIESPLTIWETATSMSQLAFFCDHHCAWRYYVQSVIRKDSYLADRVVYINATYIKFGNDKAIMGYATPDSTRGMYYIGTKCPDTKSIYDPATN